MKFYITLDFSYGLPIGYLSDQMPFANGRSSCGQTHNRRCTDS